MIGTFHFLRPWWLLALPVGGWLIWQLTRAAQRAGSWRKVVDPALQQYVLTGTAQSAGERRWPLMLGARRLGRLRRLRSPVPLGST